MKPSKRIKEELIIEEEKLKSRSEVTKRLSRLPPTSGDIEVIVKLPKLEIIKFNGTHLDWMRAGQRVY